MKVRTRLTLLFTIIAGGILLLYAGVIYYTSSVNRSVEFFALLEKEAITKANLFLDAKVDSTILQNIYLSNREILNEVEVAIYDTDFNLLYHDANHIDFVKETREMIDQIVAVGSIRFYQEGWQVIGTTYQYNSNVYVLTAAAYDEYGYKKLQRLLINSIIMMLVTMTILFFSGRYLAGKALKPVREMTEKAMEISTTNLDLRLPASNEKDELSELANTFNTLLDRLEVSFEAQKHFVTNISHELRTPLTAIISELELSTLKTRTEEEYKEVILNALADTKRLVKITNSLLNLAKASYNRSEISLKPVRVDEVLLDAKLQIQQAHKNYKMNIDFLHEIENEESLYVEGNEYLIMVAFSNLFENGCKFSDDNRCNAKLSVENGTIRLSFHNTGIGISEDDLDYLFSPFYRGNNIEKKQGSGIGLYLTKKIVDLHKGAITIESDSIKGTTVTLRMPHL